MTTNPEPTVIKLRTPPDIVAAMPVLIGFHPSESLVLMCMHGERKRAGLTMRVDLPDPGDHDRFVAEMAARCAREKADAVIAVCYTEAPDTGHRLPRGDLVDTLLDELGRHGVGWIEAVLVRGGRWWLYRCGDDDCPPGGTPLPASPSSEIVALEARGALEGRAILPSREALAASIQGPEPTREIELAQVHLRTGQQFLAEVESDGADAVLGRTLSLARGALDRYLAGEHELSDDDAARILVGLEDRLARDALLTWALDGRIQELVVLLSDLARRSPDENAAPICTVLAAVAYQYGDGALASVALERALASEPGYELARLLDASLQNQVEPAEIRGMAQRTRDRLQQWGILEGDTDRAA